jgi:hypothetical protein
MKRDKRRKGAGSGLLHNMSAAPQTQIQHQSPHRRVCGPGVIFALPENISAGPEKLLRNVQGQASTPPADGNLSRLLRHVASQPAVTGAEAERDLRERINAHALTLPFPPAALVTDRAENGDERCTDLLSIITVLAKSSGHVYLRDKEPNLAQIRPGRRVILLFPRGKDSTALNPGARASCVPGEV